MGSLSKSLGLVYVLTNTNKLGGCPFLETNAFSKHLSKRSQNRVKSECVRSLRAGLQSSVFQLDAEEAPEVGGE